MKNVHSPLFSLKDRRHIFNANERLLSNNQSDPSLARPSRSLNAICSVIVIVSVKYKCSVIAKVPLFFSPSSTHRYKHWSVRALGTFETNNKMALDLDDLAEKMVVL